MFSVALWVGAVVPVSRRPRLEFVARYALVATKFAARPEPMALPPPLMPGTLRNVAAIWTSIFGIVYDSNALNVVSHGSLSWQNCWAIEVPGVLAGPAALTDPNVSISGIC